MADNPNLLWRLNDRILKELQIIDWLNLHLACQGYLMTLLTLQTWNKISQIQRYIKLIPLHKSLAMKSLKGIYQMEVKKIIEEKWKTRKKYVCLILFGAFERQSKTLQPELWNWSPRKHFPSLQLLVAKFTKMYFHLKIKSKKIATKFGKLHSNFDYSTQSCYFKGLKWARPI